MELRKAKRYLLSALTSFRWKTSDGVPQKGQGTTRDISANGVFVLSKLGPQLGAHVELDMYLPSLSGNPKSVHLHGEGKVVRKVSDDSSETAFASAVIFGTDNSDSNILEERQPCAAVPFWRM